MSSKKNSSVIKKLYFTLIIIIVSRILNFIPIPYLQQKDFINFLTLNSFLESVLNYKNYTLSIFSLGIIPYLNASILIQIVSNFLPAFKKLRDEEQNGKETIKTITRYLTFFFTVIESFLIAFTLKRFLFNWNFEICFQIVLSLTTGSMIILWLSDLIDEFGIGNGSSVILNANIISNLPNILPKFNFINLFNILPFFIVIYGIFCIQETILKVPLITANQLYTDNRQYKNKIEQFSYLPLKLTQGAVMSVIISFSIIQFSHFILNKFLVSEFLSIEIILNFLNFIFIIFFNQLYSRLILNPKEMSKNLNKMGVAIENVTPGKDTINFLKKKINSLSILGGLGLAILNFSSQKNILYASGFNLISLIILLGLSKEFYEKFH